MGEQVRVLHIISGLVLGGVQRVVLNYAEKMPSHGIVFDYIVQKNGDGQIEADCLAAGSKIYRIPDLTRHPVGAMIQLYKLLKQHPEYKIIHVHQNDVNTLHLLVAKLAGVKVRISHSHSCRPCASRVKQMVKCVNHAFLKAVASERWACSRVAYEWLYDMQFSEKNKHSLILHNAVNIDKYAFCEQSRSHYRQELGFEGAFICVCVATLSANKNQQYLLRVFRELKERKLDAKLLLVGDGDCSERLHTMCAQLGIEDKVHFLGNRQDVDKLLSAADCMLLPSMFEGLPVSVVEAQVNGLPCILSKAVPSEVKIRDDVRFFDMTEQAVAVWADRIQELTAEHYPRDIQMCEAVKRSGFDLQTEAVRLAKKYKELSKA